MTKLSEFDVAIVGGGPAGLAAGIGFAKQGLSTIVLEKKSWPIDKACGEGIMPAGVRELDNLGVLALLKNKSHPFNGIELISKRQRRAQSDFADGKGLGVRRTVLSAALHERATHERNLVLSAHSAVSQMQYDPESIIIKSSQGQIRCRFVVGADGLRSSLRLQLNRQSLSSSSRRYGANQHFKIAPWSRFVEVYFSDGLEAYITPVSHDEIGIAFLWNYDRFSPNLGKRFLIEQCLERFPVLQERIKDCEKTTLVQSKGPFLQRVSNRADNNCVLIGDAAGYHDAITGEGISIGLIEARMLVAEVAPLLKCDERIGISKLSCFLRQQSKIRSRSNLTTQLSLLTARYPLVQAPIFSLLDQFPSLFQRFLSFSLSHCDLGQHPLGKSLEHETINE